MPIFPQTVKVATDNEQGFYICNADAVPKGAVIFGAKKPTKKPAAKKA